MAVGRILSNQNQTRSGPVSLSPDPTRSRSEREIPGKNDHPNRSQPTRSVKTQPGPHCLLCRFIPHPLCLCLSLLLVFSLSRVSDSFTPSSLSPSTQVLSPLLFCHRRRQGLRLCLHVEAPRLRSVEMSRYTVMVFPWSMLRVNEKQAMSGLPMARTQ